MADFSIQATNLSAPQGAGANVVNPVTPAQEVSEFSPNLISSVVDVFAKGLTQSRKEDAERRKNAVVQGYITEETTLNEAVVTGQMTPAQAAARSRANFNKYAAGHGEYIEDFQKAGNALRGFTQKGESEKQLETESKRLEADVSQAQSRGFQFVPGMSQQAIDAQIKASKTGLMAEQRLSEWYKEQGEKRSQGTYDQAIAAREQKEMGFQLVNAIAGDNLTAFQGYGQSVNDQVKSGKITPDAGKILINERFANISAAMQAAARTNPELAAPYRTLFEDMNKVQLAGLDPKNQVEDLKAQQDLLLTRIKVMALQRSPRLAAVVAANQLIPNNPSLALGTASDGTEALALLGEVATENRNSAPRVVGDDRVEGPTLSLLKGGLTSLKAGKVSNKEVAKVQASNSINEILTQTGQMINMGATPTQLKGVANFFASPEYAGYISDGKVNAEAAGAAKKTFQILYEPAIIKGVQERMNQVLFDPNKMGMALGGGSGSDLGGAKPKSVGETIDVKFTGSGVTFGLKTGAGVQPVELRAQQSALADLKQAQTAVNQLIHIGAHMEGSTDYAKYWEDNKHIYMPTIFPNPTQLKPGDVKDGYKYLGGAYGDRANWQSVGTSK